MNSIVKKVRKTGKRNERIMFPNRHITPSHFLRMAVPATGKARPDKTFPIVTCVKMVPFRS